MTEEPLIGAEPARLVLELEPGREPLRGRIGIDAESLEPFTGWTELGQAIARLTGSA